MKSCALLSCARPLLVGMRSPQARYCSAACRQRAKHERHMRLRDAGYAPTLPWAPQPDRVSRRIEQQFAAIEARKRRVTPKWGWL